MFKHTLTRSDYFLIAANLLPVVGTWFWQWDPKQIFMVYALETVIIGFFNLVKMGIVTGVRKKDMWYNQGSATNVSGLFFMLFFLIHYGMFVCIQTGIFIEVSGIGKQYHLGFFDFLLHWPQYLGKDAYYMLTGFLVSYGFNLIWNFIRPRRYNTISMTQLMFQPYARIFIQQFTVILGSIFLEFGAGKVFILIFAMAKTYFDVYVNFDAMLDKAMEQVKNQKGKDIQS